MAPRLLSRQFYKVSTQRTQFLNYVAASVTGLGASLSVDPYPIMLFQLAELIKYEQ